MKRLASAFGSLVLMAGTAWAQQGPSNPAGSFPPPMSPFLESSAPAETGTAVSPASLPGSNGLESGGRAVAASLMQSAPQGDPSTMGTGLVRDDLGKCDHCGRAWEDCCCEHCWTAFGEYLLLQPRGADIVFAVPSLTCTSPPLGSANQVDFGFDSGFRVGLARAICPGVSEIAATYTHFESNEGASAVAPVGMVLHPVLTHPLLDSCDNETSTLARASASINFDRADIDYRRYTDCGCLRLDWLVGFGYGQLNQDLDVHYEADRVRAASDAFGYGVRLGGGGEYGHGRVRSFAHSDLTLLASNVHASYQQINTFSGELAHYSQDLDRIIPVLDLEVGLAADITCHSVLKVGYTYSAWFNTVTTPSFISAVQGGDVTGNVDDTLTFDGIFVRLEVNW